MSIYGLDKSNIIYFEYFFDTTHCSCINMKLVSWINLMDRANILEHYYIEFSEMIFSACPF